MGFGRIGRNVFRLLYGRSDMQVGAISDVADPESLTYLLRYDSFLGRFPAPVGLRDSHLIVDDRAIPFLDGAEPGEVNWQELGVDIVVQATRKHRTASWTRRHLDAGARYVVLASVPEDLGDLPIVLWGINDELIGPDNPIVALGSNTSNAVAPILQIIDNRFGIDRVFFTTIHGFTNDQRLADVPSGQFRGSRSAAENIIPTETNSPEILGRVLPGLAGKIQAMALNVPVSEGSTVDLVTITNEPTSEEELNEAVQKEVEARYPEIIEYTTDPIVSSDVVGTHSGIFDSLATMVVDGTMCKCVVWFDNGWGYAARVIDTATRYAAEENR